MDFENHLRQTKPAIPVVMMHPDNMRDETIKIDQEIRGLVSKEYQFLDVRREVKILLDYFCLNLYHYRVDCRLLWEGYDYVRMYQFLQTLALDGSFETNKFGGIRLRHGN